MNVSALLAAEQDTGDVQWGAARPLRRAGNLEGTGLRCQTRSPRTSACRTIVMCGLALAAVSAPTPGSAEDFTRPERHFQVEQPASLEGAEALAVYNRIVDDMVAGYVLSRDSSAETFRRWRRYNQTPYRSATHGERFVNNYANATGGAYGDFQEGDELPVGSILAKDSFAVTAAGDVFSGPLFLMEKMPADFNLASRNWRYSMIMPDGSFFGVTNGDNAERVEFCITCHAAAGDENDHLFFVPEDVRAQEVDG